MLSDAKARRLRPGDKPITVGGIPGLYLRPGSVAGNGKFYLRFVSPVTGKRRDMGLGTYPTISIAEARNLAMQARSDLEARQDPIDVKRNAETEAAAKAAIPTFSEASEQTFAAISDGFKNQKHKHQWIQTLKTYVFPSIGDIQVDRLESADFARALAPIWLAKPETASCVRQRCERVMTWCIANKFVESNAVIVVGALLPKQPSKAERVSHHASVPWQKLPEVVHQLHLTEFDSVSRAALLLLILTATRSGEVRNATWDEFHFDDATWVIPARRMKTGVQHRVPLSTPALNLLQKCKSLQLDENYVFSVRTGRPISDMTITKLLRTHKIASADAERTATAHGFRSSFRDWASENGYPRDLAERALSHTIGNATEAAYHRTDLLDQRRPMMDEWARHVCSKAAILTVKSQ